MSQGTQDTLSTSWYPKQSQCAVSTFLDKNIYDLAKLAKQDIIIYHHTTPCASARRRGRAGPAWN